VRLKPEQGQDAGYMALLYDFYTKDYDLYLYHDSTIPTMGQLRKKVWPIFDVIPYRKGFVWDDKRFFVDQDKYNTFTNQVQIQKLPVITSNAEIKLVSVRDHYNKIQSDSKLVYINHLSSSGALGFTDDVQSLAKIVNEEALKFHGKSGIVIFDFPNTPVIRHITLQNPVIVPQIKQKYILGFANHHNIKDSEDWWRGCVSHIAGTENDFIDRTCTNPTIFTLKNADADAYYLTFNHNTFLVPDIQSGGTFFNFKTNPERGEKYKWKLIPQENGAFLFQYGMTRKYTNLEFYRFHFRKYLPII